jgi:hypothetical protein
MANQVFALDRLVYLDGRPTRYCVPGREPDTMETLEADGLIECRGDVILMMRRDDPRVVAWQVGVNEYLRAAGEPPAFDEVSEPIADPIGEPPARRNIH